MVSDVRLSSFSAFKKVNEPIAKENEKKGVYNKIEEEAKNIQKNLDKAKQAKDLLNDFFGGIKTVS